MASYHPCKLGRPAAQLARLQGRASASGHGNPCPRRAAHINSIGTPALVMAMACHNVPNCGCTRVRSDRSGGCGNYARQAARQSSSGGGSVLTADRVQGAAQPADGPVRPVRDESQRIHLRTLAGELTGRQSCLPDGRRKAVSASQLQPGGHGNRREPAGTMPWARARHDKCGRPRWPARRDSSCRAWQPPLIAWSSSPPPPGAAGRYQPRLAPPERARTFARQAGELVQQQPQVYVRVAGYAAQPRPGRVHVTPAHIADELPG